PVKIGARRLEAIEDAAAAGLPKPAAITVSALSVSDGKKAGRATPMSALAPRKPASALWMSGRAVSKVDGGVRFTWGIFNDASCAVGADKFCGGRPNRIASALAEVARCSVSAANVARKPFTATRCCETSRPETPPAL